MAQFPSFVITTKGAALLAKVQANGTQLKFTRAAVGDGILPTGKTLAELTALISQKQSLAINSLFINNGNATIRIIINNIGLTTGYSICEIGIFASDPDVGEILYAVTNSVSPAAEMPASGGADAREYIWDVVLVIGNTANVTASIDDSNTYTTQLEYKEHRDKNVYGEGVHGFKTDQPSAANDGQYLRWDNTNSKHVYVNAVPAGMINYFAGPTLPVGYLECNGAAVLRTTYAHLFAAIGTIYGAGDGSTTFNLPELRGEFVRGLDNGRGVDTGRSLGSAQTDELKSHSHKAPTWDGSNSGTYEVPSGGYAGYDYGAQSAPTSAIGGSETRSRNIALLACIKY